MKTNYPLILRKNPSCFLLYSLCPSRLRARYLFFSPFSLLPFPFSFLSLPFIVVFLFFIVFFVLSAHSCEKSFLFSLFFSFSFPFFSIFFKNQNNIPHLCVKPIEKTSKTPENEKKMKKNDFSFDKSVRNY